MLLYCYVPAGLLCMLYSLILILLRIETVSCSTYVSVAALSVFHSSVIS